MINAISTLLLIIIFFFFGHITQALKKLCGFITKYLLKFLSFFGFKIQTKEQTVKVDDDFKTAYGDIKKVKLSKKNIKQISSIDWLNLSLFIIVGVLVVVNMACDNAISNWIFNIQPIKLIKTAENMSTMFTAVMFSGLSFSLVKVMNRWKETKAQRKERKDYKLKQKAIKLMNSKELLTAAKNKDIEEYERLKK